MQPHWLAQVSIALFDPVTGNRHLTRNSLFSLGFRDLTEPVTLVDLRHALDVTAFDLCLLEVSVDDEGVCGLIRDLRTGTIGRNPFMVVLTTTWRQSGDLVKRVIESGADDLIVRPLSTGQLKSRIWQQIEQRKRFVVTSTYIGPDRRKEKQRQEADNLLTVPNSLRAKVEDGVLAGPTEVDMGQAKAQVERLRLSQNAFHLGLCCRLLSEHIDAGDTEVDVKAELRSLASLAKDLHARAGVEDYPEVAALCDGLAAAVERLTVALSRPEPALDEARKQVALLDALAKAIQKSLIPDKDETSHTREISDMVSRIKARRLALSDGMRIAAQA